MHRQVSPENMQVQCIRSPRRPPPEDTGALSLVGGRAPSHEKFVKPWTQPRADLVFKPKGRVGKDSGGPAEGQAEEGGSRWRWLCHQVERPRLVTCRAGLLQLQQEEVAEEMREPGNWERRWELGLKRRGEA